MSESERKKRRPERELNHENWAVEDEPEEQGVFRQASADQMSGRKILKANRRLQNNQESGPSLNPFSSIAFNFGAPITASASPPVLAPADSITSATSDDSNSGEVPPARTAAPDVNNEVDSSSSSLPARANNTQARQSMDGQQGDGAASSSSGLNDSAEAANTNGDLRQRRAGSAANANEEASSEADAYSTDSLPENHSRYDRTRREEDDEIASSSNNADNEDSSNDNYYRDAGAGGDGPDAEAEAEAEDSNSVDVEDRDQDPGNENDDSKNAEDIDSTVQEQEQN